MTSDEMSHRDEALQLALTSLARNASPQQDDIETAVRGALAAVGAMHGTAAVDGIDATRLRKDIEANINVYVGEERSLDDDDNHLPWLDDHDRQGWRFWPAYRQWQISGGLPLAAVQSLDRITDDILGKLEDPSRPGAWDRRGMVVGQVQSGKTANYTGLICKAADAGYKFIVVLTGLHNSLRSQTQQRLDEGFLGLDSRTTVGATQIRSRAVGVGAGRQHPAVSTLTSSNENGDFSRAVASTVKARIGEVPVLVVIKKNQSVLKNLIEWVTSTNGVRDPETGRMVVQGLRLLVIDDEADNASVNTKEYIAEAADDPLAAESEPSRINQLIRQLLGSFDQSALVAYTATPFANIFIAEDEHPRDVFHEDLFPRSFIVRIPPPSNYLGPTRVFGVRAAGESEDEQRRELPIIRRVDDADEWIPSKHRKDHIPGALPHTLREAIRAFILACAARAARGQKHVHNSMLVHVTLLTAVQARVAEQVEDELVNLQDRLRYGDGDGPSLRDELRTIWATDHRPTMAAMPEDLRQAPLEWEDVDAELDRAAARIKVTTVNGTSQEGLVYAEHPDGWSVIAVGGNKLSRGLTLEGLSVSYYLRATRMYDTLMQMGRWFGYRPGYSDLCRLYTTPELIDWYRETTEASEELYEKFDEMSALERSPRDFALFVRKSPAGLLVTARNKMRSGVSMKLSFSGNVIETVNFRRTADAQRRNLATVTEFLEQPEVSDRRRPAQSGSTVLHDDVRGELVADLLDHWVTADRATKARGDLLARYIRSRIGADELKKWTVALVSNTNAGPKQRVALAGIREIGLVTRAPRDAADEYRIRRLLSPSDEAIDLTPDERERALKQAEQLASELKSARLPGPQIRAVRPPTRGLLLLYPLNPQSEDGDALVPDFTDPIIGWGVSFPVSPGAPDIDYVIPRRFWE